jgi:hypothetical protein
MPKERQDKPQTKHAQQQCCLDTECCGLLSPSMMDLSCSRAMKSRQQPATVGCELEEQDSAMEPTAWGPVLWQQLYFFHSFFQSVRMQLGTDLSSSEGVWMLSKANMLHATTTETLWEYILAQVLSSPKGVCVEIQAFGCTMDSMQVFPAWRCFGCTMDSMQVFPAWRCLLRQRGNGRLPNYDQLSCLN